MRNVEIGTHYGMILVSGQPPGTARHNWWFDYEGDNIVHLRSEVMYHLTDGGGTNSKGDIDRLFVDPEDAMLPDAVKGKLIDEYGIEEILGPGNVSFDHPDVNQSANEKDN